MSKIKMAILGCGGMSGEHAKRYKSNPDVEIVALCDVKEEIVQGYIDRNLSDYPTKPQIFTDFETMLTEVKPDAVTIVTPHTMHFEHGMTALKHGVHVFMEKPMVTDSKDAKTLKKAVEESGKILVVGYNTPCTPAYKWLREKIRANEFGKLETITGWQTQGWMKGTTGSWRQNPALSGGGQMYDSGAHMFN
ncbi:Gfo/Idh/MocA family oxidoreductase, partial [bacterium]